MLPEIRRRKIFQLIAANPGEVLEVSRLIEEFNVSVSTIRRDLILMEKERQVKRVFGGVTLASQSEHDILFEYRVNLNKMEKKRIGAAAARMIKSREVIMLDSGTTTLEIAKHIDPTIKDLVVITTSLDIAVTLASRRNIKVILPGGELDSRTHGLFGPLVEETTKKIKIDKLFMGTGGISGQHLTNFNMQTLRNRRLAISRAKQIIVVADHTKFEKEGFVPLVPLSSVHRIIIDKETPPEKVAQLRKQVEVILV